MSESDKKHVGQLQVPTALALLLILLCVGGSIYGTWWWLGKDEVKSDAVMIAAPMRGRGAASRPVDQLGKVTRREDGTIRAASGNFWLLVGPPAQQREMRLHGGNVEDGLKADQQLVLRLAQRATRASNSMRTIEFTEAQKQQMKLVVAEATISMSDADRARLEGLIQTWETASDAKRPEAQKNLLLAVREIAKKNMPAARAAYAANVEKLRGMMSQEQIEKYRQIEMARRGNGGGGAAPTARPTTAPAQGA